MTTNIRALLETARSAARSLLRSSSAERDTALDAIARHIDASRASILAANAEDVRAAPSLSASMRDRLTLDDTRISAMIRSIDEVRALPDPLAAEREIGRGRSGVRVLRRRVPLGVIGIVYEARPNVTAECTALTLKSGNAVVLRGGREALGSNVAIHAAIVRGLREVGIAEGTSILVTDPSRSAVLELLGATGLVDLVIPRGGPGLMAMVDEHARVPVIRHGTGVCHVYIHASADAEMAMRIAVNAKVERPGVCNAMETLLVDERCIEDVLARLGPAFFAEHVELRADARAAAVLRRHGVAALDATDADWDTEFLSLVLAIRTVPDLDEAIDHIARHGTHHTAAIVASDEADAERFLREVDASCVLWNASTRLNDGGELGLGAEMGISTSKMHAYGPMSLTELTAEKLVVYGHGEVR